MTRYLDHVRAELDGIREAGLHKRERHITTPQRARVGTIEAGEVINLCANNYLGLAGDPTLISVAHAALEKHGYGMASVRFICGTQNIHQQLEERISAFVGQQAAILYASCFDANGGLFETLLTEQDAVISDQLNHASIIDGIRLCKAQRFRYANNDMQDLETQLIAAKDARFRLIATDGVFSMDGTIARLADICELADKHDALVMVDDSHATGFIGANGRGTPELHGVQDRIDILTSTFGKALGGASGGFTAARQPIVDLLRQRSRPYLFSNSLCPIIASGTLAVLDILERSPELRNKLQRLTGLFRDGMRERGFDIPAGDHPIVPIMLGDAALATRMADALLERGIYVVGFSYPVVPKGTARIRVQISAAHDENMLTMAMDAFAAVRDQLA